MILLCSIFVTGVIQKSNEATYSILSNQASSKKDDLESHLNTRRRNITTLSRELSEKIEQILSRRHVPAGRMPYLEDIYAETLETALDDLIAFTKSNAVTGVFLVLDPSRDMADETKAARACIYLRDSSPGLVTGNNGNLLLEYGRVDVAREKGIAVNYLWERDMAFTGEYYRGFYFLPLNAALSGPPDPERPQTYGHWSAPFSLKKDDVSIITYSLPLILSDGTICGVIGFDLETNYISSLMPSSEVPYDGGCYLLGANANGKLHTDSVVSSGAYARQFLSGPPAEIVGKAVQAGGKGGILSLHSANFPHNEALGAYTEIDLYEAHSPFYLEKWALVCMAPEESVLSGTRGIMGSITISIFSTTVLALVLSVFVIHYIFHPIRMLAEKVKSIDPEKPVRLGRTEIREIDRLSAAFEELSDNVSAAAARMFKIIELVDMPLGSFEIRYRENTVRLSRSMYKLMELPEPEEAPYVLPLSVWNDFLRSLSREGAVGSEDEITEILYSLSGSELGKKWVRMRVISEPLRDTGVLIDVTEEILQKQRLEYERNYDPLTKLHNRQSFFDRANELLRANADRAGVMMFADLDDLKFVNDLHGHETGDEYIKTFALFLTRFHALGAITGRMSGDEFVMFAAGFASQEEAREAFYNVFSNLNAVFVLTPGGTPHKLRVSVGLAYYPLDSGDVQELVHFADYAMYEIKHTMKGEVREFDIGAYNKNAFVLNTKDLLNLIIEEKRVRFAFQPIVDVRTGEVFGYEALMRSMLRELKSPEDILRVARSQSKLYQLERMALEVVFDWMTRNPEKVADKKMFINTIPNQIFTEADMDELCGKYGHLFHRAVFEITEHECFNQQETKRKMDAFCALGAKVAIDDYGSGYSNELSLLMMAPDYLKIDMRIVRNIDKDADKQLLTRNIIGYAEQRQIMVVAEGVETYEELQAVIHLGVHYVQGYYLGRPELEPLDIPTEFKDSMVLLSKKRRDSHERKRRD